MVTNLKREKYQSCGCNIPIPYKATDETGRKYNRLTIIEIIREKGCRAKCRCICDCGNENTLRFDFGVYNEDNQLVHLIEQLRSAFPLL
jgi:hypothetical protein